MISDKNDLQLINVAAVTAFWIAIKSERQDRKNPTGNIAKLRYLEYEFHIKIRA